MMNTEKARFNMVEQQIRPWNVFDSKILNLMATIPRELFVPDQYKSIAFADTAIKLAHGQQMNAPKEDAKILQALAIKPNDRVLEIGTGSGFFTALLASQAKRVKSIELFPEFVENAQNRFRQLGLTNIECDVLDVTDNWTISDSFDVIVVSPSLATLPDLYTKQLRNNGRLFYIINKGDYAVARILNKNPSGNIAKHDLFEMSTPGLINEQAVIAFKF